MSGQPVMPCSSEQVKVRCRGRNHRDLHLQSQTIRVEDVYLGYYIVRPRFDGRMLDFVFVLLKLDCQLAQSSWAPGHEAVPRFSNIMGKDWRIHRSGVTSEWKEAYVPQFYFSFPFANDLYRRSGPSFVIDFLCKYR